MSDDISPSEYYDVVGQDVRRADSEKMWLRRGIQIGREEGPLAANRRVAGFSDTTPRQKDLLQHGVAIGQASKLGPSTDFTEERIEQIYRERMKDQSVEAQQLREALTKEIPKEMHQMFGEPRDWLSELKQEQQERPEREYDMEVER